MNPPLPRPRPTKQEASADAAKEPVGCTSQRCKLGDIIAYDIEGHYIGTKPPVGDEAYLSTKAVVDAHREGEKVDREAIIADPATKYLCRHHDLLLLAGIAYGEASTLDVYEEMAGIAYVLVRQMKARKQATMSDLVANHSNFAYAAKDGNPRFAAFEARSPQKVDKREGNDGMRLAIKGAINAILQGTDYSNGAYFWDGVDLGTNYSKHDKITKGFDFTSADHQIFNVGGQPIADNSVPKTTWWYGANGKATKERGSYSYTYESTAAWGKTVFSKYTSGFLGATGNREYQ